MDLFTSRSWGWRGYREQLDDGISRAFFEPLERDIAYVSTFRPFVGQLGMMGEGESSTPFGDEAAIEVTHRLMNKLYTLMLDWFSPVESEASLFEDPFITYSDVGWDLTFYGGAMAGAGGIIEGIAAFFQADQLANVLTGPMKTAGMYLLGIGVLFQIVIPFIPIAYYFSAVISWLILCVEALLALPLALLVYLLPARGTTDFVGPLSKVILTLFNLLLRPFFTVLGLILCIALLWVGNALLSLFMQPMLTIMSPDSSLQAIVMILGLIGLYAYGSVLLALHASSLITMFGDEVLGWISARAGRFAENSIAPRMEARAETKAPIPQSGLAYGAIAGGGRTVGGAITSGAGHARNKIKSIRSQ